MRLTKAIREGILDNLAAPFMKELSDIDKLKTKLGHDIYADIYPKSILDKMSTLPKEAFPPASHLSVRFEGVANWVQIPIPKGSRVFYTHAYNCAAIYDESDQFSIRYKKLKERKELLKKREKEAMSEARGILNSVTTMEKLIKVWPEIEPFAKEFIKSETKTIAVTTKKANELLGL